MRPAGCALTVDVEEWFHICGVGPELSPNRWPALPSRVVANTRALLDMLDRRQVRATFFVLGYVAEHYPELVRGILAGGHEVGSHGHMHTRVYEMTPGAFAADLDRSLAALGGAGAPLITAFRAPEWSINDRSLWALDALASRGFRIDSSMAPLRMVGNARYPQSMHLRTTRAGSLVECPPMVSRRWGQNVPGGGGWGLRMQAPAAALGELERRAHIGQTSILVGPSMGDRRRPAEDPVALEPVVRALLPPGWLPREARRDSRRRLLRNAGDTRRQGRTRMIPRTAAVLGLLGMMGSGPAWAQTSSRAPIKGVGVDERLDDPAALAPALASAGIKASDIGAFVRLLVPWATLDAARASGRWETIDARIDEARRVSAPVLVAVEHTPIVVDGSTAWSDAVRAVADHLKGRVAGYEIDVEAGAARPDARAYAFFIRLAAVQIRSVDPEATVAQTPVADADRDWQVSLYGSDAATTIDAVPVAGGADVIRRLVRDRDPTAVVMSVGLTLDAQPAAAASQWLVEALSRLGDAPATAATFTGSPEAVAAVVVAARELRDVLDGSLLPIDPASVSLAVEQNGADVAARVPHRLFYNVRSGSTYFVYWGMPAGGPPLAIALVDPSGRHPTLRDAIRRQVSPAPAFAADAATHRSRFEAPASVAPIVVDFNYGGETTFVSNTEVSGMAALAVEEIIFRNQEAEARQASLYTAYIATLKTRFHFRPSGSQIFDVVSDSRLYATRDDVEWEELTFSVNGAKWGSDRPAFPLLQAEKVLSKPLDLRLTTDYRYRLAGIDTIDEHRCYAVDFDPVDASAARYRGRVWIDTTTFLRVKVDSVQTHLGGAIVSNQVTETYAPVATVRGQALQFVTHITTRQLVLIAGRNLLVEKDDWYSDFRVDPPDFDAERRAARASDRIMYRDTDQGVRFLVKQGETRVVSDKLTQRSKALAMGTRIDPAFDFPLPILGINYLNFAFLGTNSQMAMLFGGVFIAGNVQKPKLGRTPLDASVDFYGIAVPGTDKAFAADGEDVDARVMSIPASTGVNLGWQFMPFQKVTVGYQLQGTKYFAPPDTTGDFVIPSSTATHGLSGGYEFRRGGYSIAASAATYHRMSWAPWGRPGDYDPSHQTYQLYSIGGSKDFLRGPFQAIHVGVAYFGGQHLDRFSMYQFDMFSDVQMHGVPASGVRFPSLVLARGSVLDQRPGAVQARSVPRPGLRAGPAGSHQVEPRHGHRRGRDLPRALEYDVLGRRRQELPAGALPSGGVVHRADHAAEATLRLASDPMRADLHCHSFYSGYARHMPVLHARDCYSPPEDVYRAAKARGMDLVCLTDHDSLDGGLAFLDAHPGAEDFLLGEEIECRVPDAPGLRVHLGAIGMTERVHRDVQPLRGNALDVAACLREAGVFFSVNHLFLLFREELPVERYVREMIALGSDGLEVRNGAAGAEHNALVTAIADGLRHSGRAIGVVGGSDAHSLRWVGTTWTESPARTRDEFLADLRAGRTRAGGVHGERLRMLSEIYRVVGSYWGSLLGLERWEPPASARVRAAAISALLLPFQFVPAVVALRLKAGERRRVARYRDIFAADRLTTTIGAPGPELGT